MTSNLGVVPDECFVTAFYGINSGTEATAAFYSTMVDWFVRLNHAPDVASVHGVGYSGKPISFTRVNKKIQKTGFSNIKGFSIFSLLPDAKIPMNDYYLSVTYDNTTNGSYALIAVRSAFSNVSAESILLMSQSAISALKPTYGIGYSREHKLGPSLYAIGIGQETGFLQGEAYEQALQLSRWATIGMVEQVYRDGVLRDVYQWNFLTRAQLTARVDGVSLKEWIQQSEERGFLRLLSDEVWLWEVEGFNILSVQASLRNAGIIFDWRKYL